MSHTCTKALSSHDDRGTSFYKWSWKKAEAATAGMTRAGSLIHKQQGPSRKSGVYGAGYIDDKADGSESE